MNYIDENFINMPTGKVWYGITGIDNKTPLLTIHGGPGYPHDYLEPLADLSDERKVIFYDQLGCGNSQKTSDSSLWTLDYFTHELKELIKTLKLENYHILGQSWGAALAVSLALTKPDGLKSIILADPYISTPIWEKDIELLLQNMPEAIQKILKSGDIKSKEYKSASDTFYYQHVWRLNPLPVAGIKSDHKMNSKLYTYMWGPEEFLMIGTLKNLDLSLKLSEIKIPTLLLCGRYDEATPESTQYFQSCIPNAQIRIFERSAHMPQWTERKEYISTIRNFLQNIEK
ncbi:MAG: proline iminopeptidase-family hydrolase [Candidatus Levybacteria bacterium]|nr:proline iminopeptidase-family hydrolase [Candidatus Levybacteria bacterium]